MKLKDVLESNLNQVAIDNKLCIENIKTLCNDDCLHIDDSNNLYYKCPIRQNINEITSVDINGTSLLTNSNMADITNIPNTTDVSIMPDIEKIVGDISTYIFKLHSRLSATKKIYLHFNGATLTNTTWNIQYKIETLIFEKFNHNADININYTYIQKIWNHISNDYSPFDVDVTTEEPTSPWTGVKCVITNTIPQAFGNKIGGIAYVSSWGTTPSSGNYIINNQNYYNIDISPVCFAFNIFDNYINIALAASHEIGHTLGLHHQGTSTLEYYQGVAGTNWAPIMGVGYYVPIVQWCKLDQNNNYFGTTTGYNPRYNIIQDDIAIIKNTLSIVEDDYTNNIIDANNVLPIDSSIRKYGIISSNVDYDYIKFRSNPGPITINGYANVNINNTSDTVTSHTLDLQLSLYDSTHKSIGTSSKPIQHFINNLSTIDYAVNSIINYTVPSKDESDGIFYIKASGIGSTYYTAYTSLGNYMLDFNLQTYSPATLDPTYIITADKTTINENESVTFTIITTNVAIGTQLYWTNDGTSTNNDFITPQEAKFGSFTITDNPNTITFTTIPDHITEGTETIILNIRTISITGSSVATSSTVNITDSSISLVAIPTYIITCDKTTITENESVIFTIITTNVAIGTLLYWTNDSTSSNSDFITPLEAKSGSFITTSNPNTNTITFTTNPDYITEGIESIILNIRTMSTTSPSVATNTVNIVDTFKSLGVNQTYKIYSTSTSINKGQSVRFRIITTNVDDNTLLYWSNIGSSAADNFIPDKNYGSITITNNMGTFILTAIDTLIPISKNIIINIRSKTIDGSIVATSRYITIVGATMPEYSITSNTINIKKGQSVKFIIATTNVNNGTTLHWNNDGTTIASNFIQNINSGSFIINNNVGIVVLTVIKDFSSEDTKNIIINIRTGSSTGQSMVISEPVTILGISNLPSYKITSGSGSGSNNIINKGQSIRFVITTTNIVDGTILYWTNDGTTIDRDFTQNINHDQLTVNKNRCVIILTSKNTLTTNNNNTIIINIRTGSITGPIIITSNTIIIN
jgi:hypothetical protein